MSILRVILLLLRALFRDRSRLALENLALRQQLAILHHKVVRPKLRHAERAFWVRLAQVWESRGQPCVRPEMIRLIRRMSRENPLWGVPRIRSELLLLGHDVAEATVAKYMTRRGRRPPSQTWRTFLRNHLRTTAACDFFVIPTATFRLLFCFVILSHEMKIGCPHEHVAVRLNRVPPVGRNFQWGQGSLVNRPTATRPDHTRTRKPRVVFGKNRAGSA